MYQRHIWHDTAFNGIIAYVPLLVMHLKLNVYQKKKLWPTVALNGAVK